MVRLALPLTLLASSAFAHDAPSGWTYPPECCSSIDCREVKESEIREVPGGYYVEKSQEMISYKSYKAKDSLDGKYHLCTEGGVDGAKVFCIFIPPRAF